MTATPEGNAPPRILCVDDERAVLDGLSLHLRRRYQVLTAQSGAEGLEILGREAGINVVVSDMRMPVMDGAAFLTRARALVPDVVRVLLTGQADLDSAIAVINEGRIFRFLTKPCPPATMMGALEAAVEQHRLITSERVLLEQTLHGSIKALTDILALANPEPEVDPVLARRYAAVVATGRSDEPNQINNVLAFPGIFRGLLNAGAKKVTEEIGAAAAHAIADVVTADELSADYIVPTVFNPNVVTSVTAAVEKIVTPVR